MPHILEIAVLCCNIVANLKVGQSVGMLVIESLSIMKGVRDICVSILAGLLPHRCKALMVDYQGILYGVQSMP